MKLWAVVLLTVSCLLGGTSLSNAAIIYTESFPNAGANANFASVGWNANITASGTVDNAATNSVVSNATGKTNVIGYGAKTGTGTVGFFWTTEIGTVPLANINSISFYSNNAVTTDALRIAVLLDNGTTGVTSDDFWVASNTGFIRNSATAGSSTNWVANGELETLAFTTAAADWRDLTFVSGTSLSLATSARGSALPAGNILGIGFFGSLASDVTQGHGGVIRFDELNVDVIPEPSTLLLGLGFVGLTLCRFRRRES